MPHRAPGRRLLEADLVRRDVRAAKRGQALKAVRRDAAALELGDRGAGVVEVAEVQLVGRRLDPVARVASLSDERDGVVGVEHRLVRRDRRREQLALKERGQASAGAVVVGGREGRAHRDRIVHQRRRTGGAVVRRAARVLHRRGGDGRRHRERDGVLREREVEPHGLGAVVLGHRAEGAGDRAAGQRAARALGAHGAHHVDLRAGVGLGQLDGGDHAGRVLVPDVLDGDRVATGLVDVFSDRRGQRHRRVRGREGGRSDTQQGEHGDSATQHGDPRLKRRRNCAT